MVKLNKIIAVILGVSLIACSGCSLKKAIKTVDKVNKSVSSTASSSTDNSSTAQTIINSKDIAGIEFDGKNAFVTINKNKPQFTKSDITTDAFEKYSDLDNLGRCGVAFANICKELMPTEERGRIGMVKPSGWHTTKYDCVSGKYLYNRCHLIGYQLAGENANEKNLITGTRYLNIEGMLPFENMVTDYVKETGNHVLYRVTPVYDGNNLVAKGVQMEGYSVEDNGKGVSFNIFCFNAQPGVQIDYATGESQLTEEGKKMCEDNSGWHTGE